MKIIFMPHAFDDFEGTQEELDNFVSSLKELVESENFLENSSSVNLSELEELDPMLAEKILQAVAEIDMSDRKNKLN